MTQLPRCLKYPHHDNFLVGKKLNRQELLPVFLSLQTQTDKKQKTVSDHLFAERERLLTLITKIRNSGAVAPANVWISPNFQNKGGKTYEYYKLTSDNPEVKHLGLGKMGSEKYRDWFARIQRRSVIAELEHQLSMLQALIDRQSTTILELPNKESS